MATRPWQTFFMISVGVSAPVLDLFIVNIACPTCSMTSAGQTWPHVLSGSVSVGG